MVDSAYSFVSVLINDEDIDTSKPPPTPGKSIERDFPDIYRKFDQPTMPLELKSTEVKHHPLPPANQKYNFSVLDRREPKKVTIRKFPNQNRSQWMEEVYSTSGSNNSVRKDKVVKREQKRKRSSFQVVDAISSQNKYSDSSSMALYLVLRASSLDHREHQTCSIEGFDDVLWKRFEEYFNLREVGPRWEPTASVNPVDGKFDNPMDGYYLMRLEKALNFLADNGYRVISSMGGDSCGVWTLERKEYSK